MKKFIYLIVALLAVASASCSKKGEPQKWEYKIVEIWGTSYNDFFPNAFPPEQEQESKLNELGREGWELVGAYTQVSTTHPNFGNEKYVTGLQPNTRTQGIYYVFKRPLIENSDKAVAEPDTTVVDSVEVVEAVEAVETVDTVVAPY